jgi:hypothetical protein
MDIKYVKEDIFQRGNGRVAEFQKTVEEAVSVF